MQINTPKKRTKTKVLVITALVVVALLIGGLTYAYFQKVWPFASTQKNVATDTKTDTNTVNYDPPTNQEVKDSQDGKKNSDNTSDDSPKKDDTGSSTTKPKKTASVGIAYADVNGNNLEIRAFTNSVIEGTGTCTATATMVGMSDMKVTKSSEAFIDASSTQCRPIYIPLSQLHSGSWKVSVKFASPDYTGKSETVEVKIP